MFWGARVWFLPAGIRGGCNRVAGWPDEWQLYIFGPSALCEWACNSLASFPPLFHMLTNFTASLGITSDFSLFGALHRWWNLSARLAPFRVPGSPVIWQDLDPTPAPATGGYAAAPKTAEASVGSSGWPGVDSASCGLAKLTPGIVGLVRALWHS